MNSGYDNSGFYQNDGNTHNGNKTSTLEMEQVIVAETVAAKCCGGSDGTNQNLSANIYNNCAKTPSTDVTQNVCLPKCPAVKASPWDPVKTRFAAVLTMAMVVWLLLGIFVIKY